MNEEDPLQVGDAVIYHDPEGNAHNALLTSVWGTRANRGTVNLVFVSSNDAERDNYGRQTKHESSVQHATKVNGVHGRYWRFADESANAGVRPTSV